MNLDKQKRNALAEIKLVAERIAGEARAALKAKEPPSEDALSGMAADADRLVHCLSRVDAGDAS